MHLSFKLKTYGAILEQWSVILKREFPGCQDEIPQSKELNIGKLGSGGAITADTCNAVQKTRRLRVEEVLQYSTHNNVLEVNYWHHLRNVWLGGMTNRQKSIYIIF